MIKGEKLEHHEQNRDVSEIYTTAEIQRRFDEYRKKPPDFVLEKSRGKLHLSSKNGELGEYLNAKIKADPTFYFEYPRTIEEFKAKYQLKDTNFLDSGIAEAFNEFLAEVQRVEKRVYWSFCLQEAKVLLIQVLPEIADLVEKIVEETSFLDIYNDLEVLNDFENYQYGATPIGTGDAYIITVPLSESYDRISANQLLRIRILAHELYHLVNFYYVKENFGPDTHNVPIHDEHTILFTLLEATSLAVEHLIDEQLKQHPTNEQIEWIERYGKFRLKYLYQGAKYKHDKPRTKVTEYISEEGLLEGTVTEKQESWDFPILNYTEGAQLAIRLRRNGWTIHDVLELWKELKKIIDGLITEYKDQGRRNFWSRYDIYSELAMSGTYSSWSMIKKHLVKLKKQQPIT